MSEYLPDSGAFESPQLDYHLMGKDDFFGAMLTGQVVLGSQGVVALDPSERSLSVNGDADVTRQMIYTHPERPEISPEGLTADVRIRYVAGQSLVEICVMKPEATIEELLLAEQQ